MEETAQTENSHPKKQNFPPVFIIGGLIIVVLAVIFVRFQMKKSSSVVIPSPVASAETSNSVDQTSMTVSPEPSQSPQEMTSSMSGENVAGVTTSSAQTQTDGKTLNIETGSYYFKPNSFTVKKGDTVKIVLTNHDGFHDFVLDDFHVKIGPIPAGQTASATFTADKAGTFKFYCSVGQHRKMGQEGTLIVQ